MIDQLQEFGIIQIRPIRVVGNGLQTIEKIFDRDIQNTAEVVKSARRYSIHSALVLLNLLERNFQLICDGRLAETQFLAALPEALADKIVDVYGG